MDTIEKFGSVAIAMVPKFDLPNFECFGCRMRCSKSFPGRRIAKVWIEFYPSFSFFVLERSPRLFTLFSAAKNQIEIDKVILTSYAAMEWTQARQVSTTEEISRLVVVYFHKRALHTTDI